MLENYSRLSVRASVGALFAVCFAASAFAQQPPAITIASAFGTGTATAPGSIAIVRGTGLSFGTEPATVFPLPKRLHGVTINIKQGALDPLPASLYLVTPTSVTFVIPAPLDPGPATVEVVTLNNTFTVPLTLTAVAPALATVQSGNPQDQTAVAQAVQIFSTGANPQIQPLGPIDVTQSNLFVILYGTGFRLHSQNPISAKIDGISVPVSAVRPNEVFPGLDEIEIGPLPPVLRGRGKVSVEIVVDGAAANIVTIEIQ